MWGNFFSSSLPITVRFLLPALFFYSQNSHSIMWQYMWTFGDREPWQIVVIDCQMKIHCCWSLFKASHVCCYSQGEEENTRVSSILEPAQKGIIVKQSYYRQLWTRPIVLKAPVMIRKLWKGLGKALSGAWIMYVLSVILFGDGCWLDAKYGSNLLSM